MLKSVTANNVPLLSYTANLYACVGNAAVYTVKILSPDTTSDVDLDTVLFAISNILIVTVAEKDWEVFNKAVSIGKKTKTDLEIQRDIIINAYKELAQ